MCIEPHLQTRVSANHLAITQTLNDHGVLAYLVGGGVRDRILGRTPKDHDISTSATPDQVRRLFPHAEFVGAHFGVSLTWKWHRSARTASTTLPARS